MTICSAALLCACGKPAVRDLQRDDDFTDDVLRSARFAIGSVALARGNLAEFRPIRAEIENILWNRLVENIESISLMPPKFAADALSESSRVYLGDQFESSGKIDDKCRMIIALAASDSIDYFIFARIDEDAIYTSESPISNDKGESIGAYYMTTRRIGGYFFIFNAATGRKVWSGHLSAKETIQNRYEDDQSDGILGGIIEDILLGGNEPGYPEPASMQTVSSKLFHKFAETLMESK
jgi:hypothetical protein